MTELSTPDSGLISHNTLSLIGLNNKANREVKAPHLVAVTVLLSPDEMFSAYAFIQSQGTIDPSILRLCNVS